MPPGQPPGRLGGAITALGNLARLEGSKAERSKLKAVNSLLLSKFHDRVRSAGPDPAGANWGRPYKRDKDGQWLNLIKVAFSSEDATTRLCGPRSTGDRAGKKRNKIQESGTSGNFVIVISRLAEESAVHSTSSRDEDSMLAFCHGM